MGIVQGCGVDTDLNDKGQWQAQRFFEAYKHIPFQSIFVSELKRTHQTVAPFTQNLKIPQHIIPALNEINWGIMEGAAPTKESATQFHAMVASWRNGNLHEAVEGGETPNELYQRQAAGLTMIEELLTEKPTLICMHGRAMRSFLCLLTQHPLHLMDDFEHDNVCLYILEKQPQDTSFKIILNNCKAHLR